MEKIITQDIKRDRSNYRCSKDNTGYEENGGRNKYNSHRDGRDNFDGQY